MELYYLLFTLVLISTIISILKKQSATTYKEPKIYPYAKKMLLTKTEYAFYKALRSETDEKQFLICPKVRLEDFIYVTDKDNRAKYRGYIKSRHVDFLICDNDLNILCGIELDDKSHNTRNAQAIDKFKNNIFEVIDIPLYRIRTVDNYTSEIRKLMTNLSKKSKS